MSDLSALDAVAEFYGERFWKLPEGHREAFVRDVILVKLEDLPGSPFRSVVQELDRRIGNYLEAYSGVLVASEAQDAD